MNSPFEISPNTYYYGRRRHVPTACPRCGAAEPDYGTTESSLTLYHLLSRVYTGWHPQFFKHHPTFGVPGFGAVCRSCMLAAEMARPHPLIDRIRRDSAAIGGPIIVPFLRPHCVMCDREIQFGQKVIWKNYLCLCDYRCLKAYNEGRPCSHAGCLSHVRERCENCGRVGGRRKGQIWDELAGRSGALTKGNSDARFE